ncbi:MAG: alpha/beta hydrolase [Cyclobacteriaceae bacterium]|nr:alpha/beta hydrolase [Cyclobacteriaceae bacterium]
MRRLIVLLLISIAPPALAQPAIKVEKTGKGTPVLFLPGFITPGSVWKETVANLKGKHEAHLVSYAGFNGNTPIAMPWYSTIKKELVEYVKINKLKNLKLIGHSMGGNLAVDLAAELGDVVDKIIIVDALACMREVMMPGVSAEALQYESPYNKQMLEMNNEAFLKSATMMAQGMTTVTEKQELIKSWILEADRKTYVYGYTDLLKLDVRPALAQIKVPVLILGAPFPTKEIVLPNYEKQYINLANKQLEIAPGGRHYIMFDQPEWLYNQINNFLTK